MIDRNHVGIDQRQLDVLERARARQQIELLEHETDLPVADLGELVVVKPLDRVLDGLVERLLVGTFELGSHLVVADGVAHIVGVVLERVARLDALLVLVVLGLVPVFSSFSPPFFWKSFLGG